MFKKFLTNMVITAVEEEFGFGAALAAKNITFYKENCDKGETNIYFSFETIFEDCTVYGWIMTNGTAKWVTGHDSYKVTKSYYAH